MAARERLICRADEVVDGGRGIRFGLRDRERESGFVIRYQGRVYAYRNRCAHIPVELDWQPGEFFDFSGLYLICATHGALYAPDTGECLGGRCNGSGLVRLHVTERGGEIFLIEDDIQGAGTN